MPMPCIMLARQCAMSSLRHAVPALSMCCPELLLFNVQNEFSDMASIPGVSDPASLKRLIVEKPSLRLASPSGLLMLRSLVYTT